MGCCCRPTCIIPIIVGIIAGIIAIVVGSIPSITTFLWIVFGISILALLILVVLSIFLALIGSDGTNCVCRNGVCLIIGAFGALVTSIISLATGLATTILLFLLAGFFAWTLVALLVLLICLATENCG